MKTPTPEKLFHQPTNLPGAMEQITIRLLPTEIEALDAFVKSETGCESRRQLICEALEYYLGQPKDDRTTYRKQIATVHGGKNPHKKRAGRPKGRRNNPKPIVETAPESPPAIPSAPEAVSPVPKPATTPARPQATKPTVASRLAQQKLPAKDSSGW